MNKLPVFLVLLLNVLTSCGPKKHNKTNAHLNIKYIKMNNLQLPSSKDPIVLRTDFSDENAWKTICAEIMTPHPQFGFLPNVVFASDTNFQAYTEEQLLSDSTSGYEHAFIFIVDKITMTNPEHPILCLGLKENHGFKLRTIPSEMWGIENNLSISNIDFEELSQAVDKDGIFRGFK